MAQSIVANVISFRDHRGQVGKTRFYVAYDNTVTGSVAQASAFANTIFEAIEDLSNGAVIGTTGISGQVLTPLAYGATAQYANAEDKLVVRMLAADLTLHKLEIPCPVLSAFELDQETALGSAIADLVTQLTSPAVASSFPCTKAGSPFTFSVGGQLRRRRFQRKLTIYGKSANLDEPEE